MKIEDFGLAGAFILRPRKISDDRGDLVKTFHAPTFEEHRLRTDWREEFYSTSRVGVIRGMHFQMPPAQHAKLVTCVAGAVIDVAIDLRRGSPTEKIVRSVVLDEVGAAGLYLPSGIAHGFQSTSATSTMLYKVTSVHAPEQDAGIAWNSFGFDWPIDNPVISDRDRSHPSLDAFESPFVFNQEAATR